MSHNKLYKDFNWSHEKQDYGLDFHIPIKEISIAQCIGKGVAIGYTSDKHTKGEYLEYIHHFETKVDIIVQGNKAKSNCFYQNPFPMEFSFLGFALDLQYLDLASGESFVLDWTKSRYKPILGWNIPTKSLFVANQSGGFPVVITGKKLDVTEAGIIN